MKQKVCQIMMVYLSFEISVFKAVNVLLMQFDLICKCLDLLIEFRHIAIGPAVFSPVHFRICFGFLEVLSGLREHSFFLAKFILQNHITRIIAIFLHFSVHSRKSFR